MAVFNTSKYSLSEFKLKGSLYTGIKLSIENGDDSMSLFPAEVFELGSRLIDWVRSQNYSSTSDITTVSEVEKPLTFVFIDYFTYKILENGKIVGMVFWSNVEESWKTMFKSGDISIKNRYRADLFEETQIEYDKLYS